MSCITTCSGKSIDLFNPNPDQIDINDIAHNLSQINRFNGGTKWPYSVAQHSVIVSRIVHPKFALLGLLHDAAEAYTGDISAPIKCLLISMGCNAISEIERLLLAVILLKYGVQPGETTEAINPVHCADMQVRATEFRDLFEVPQVRPELPIPLDSSIRNINQATAKRSFLIRFHELTEGKYEDE